MLSMDLGVRGSTAHWRYEPSLTPVAEGENRLATDPTHPSRVWGRKARLSVDDVLRAHGCASTSKRWAASRGAIIFRSIGSISHMPQSDDGGVGRRTPGSLARLYSPVHGTGLVTVAVVADHTALACTSCLVTPHTGEGNPRSGIPVPGSAAAVNPGWFWLGPGCPGHGCPLVPCMESPFPARGTDTSTGELACTSCLVTPHW